MLPSGGVFHDIFSRRRYAMCIMFGLLAAASGAGAMRRLRKDY
jgi:hypothetical protein